MSLKIQEVKLVWTFLQPKMVDFSVIAGAEAGAGAGAAILTSWRRNWSRIKLERLHNNTSPVYEQFTTFFYFSKRMSRKPVMMVLVKHIFGVVALFGRYCTKSVLYIPTGTLLLYRKKP